MRRWISNSLLNWSLKAACERGVDRMLLPRARFTVLSRYSHKYDDSLRRVTLPRAAWVIYSDFRMPTTGERFERAVAIMERLRAPGGCPWDREQTFDSIKPFTLEETYEVLEAIDNRDWHELAGELGDLLLQVLFYAEMAKEQGSFSIDDVMERLSTKLINRHPHVFGDVKADTSAEVKRNWEAIKVEERKLEESKKRQSSDAEDPSKKNEKRSILASVSSAMPS